LNPEEGLVVAQTLSVTELNRLVRQRLETGFPLCRVRGEIADLSHAASGHVYFTLVDEAAQVRCTLWRQRAQLLGWTPKEGVQVEALALIGLYEARGEYQLNVEALYRCGQGTLNERFLRTRARLESEGLFDPARRRTLPFLAKRVAIVASLQAAALHDVLSTLQRRAPQLGLCIFPTPVQGEAAAPGIVAAITAAGEIGCLRGCEVLILCRGGGAAEDLAAFNEEIVARAIRACPIPVVCGVGHETDFSIADFAADLRAPTPTAAAELVCLPRDDLVQVLAGYKAQMGRSLRRRLHADTQRLDMLASRLVSPADRLAQHQQQLKMLRQGLKHQWQQQHVRRRERLDYLLTQLHLLDPHAVLQRGYSLVHDEQGELVRSAGKLKLGASINLQFAKGSAKGRLEAIKAK